MRIALSRILLLACIAAAAGRGQFLETVIPVGATPRDIAWNATSNKVYVPNGEDGTVSVIDGATNQVRATIRVADGPNAVCWNPVLNKVYCTSDDPDWLSVMDGAGDTLIRKARMRGAPVRMAFNALMNKLYVACIDDCMVRVYDGMADTLVAEVWFGELCSPFTLLWHPVSNRVFCTTWCDTEDTVFVIDCVTDEVVERRPVGRCPYAMCWNERNDLVYVSAGYSIYALTARGDSVVDSIPTYAGDMRFVPFPNKIYAVTNWTVVIDCDLNVVTESLPYQGDVAVCDTHRAKVYSAAKNVHQLYVFDGQSDALIATIPMGRSPERICWNSTNSRVYINDVMDNVVYVIRDTSSGVGGPAGLLPMLGRKRSTLSRGRLQIRPGSSVAVYDAAGRWVFRAASGAARRVNLRPGAYFVRCDDADEVEKVVVVR